MSSSSTTPSNISPKKRTFAKQSTKRPAKQCLTKSKSKNVKFRRQREAQEKERHSESPAPRSMSASKVPPPIPAQSMFDNSFINPESALPILFTSFVPPPQPNYTWSPPSKPPPSGSSGISIPETFWQPKNPNLSTMGPIPRYSPTFPAYSIFAGNRPMFGNNQRPLEFLRYATNPTVPTSYFSTQSSASMMPKMQAPIQDITNQLNQAVPNYDIMPTPNYDIHINKWICDMAQSSALQQAPSEGTQSLEAAHAEEIEWAQETGLLPPSSSTSYTNPASDAPLLHAPIPTIAMPENWIDELIRANPEGADWLSTDHSVQAMSTSDLINSPPDSVKLQPINVDTQSTGVSPDSKINDIRLASTASPGQTPEASCMSPIEASIYEPLNLQVQRCEFDMPGYQTLSEFADFAEDNIKTESKTRTPRKAFSFAPIKAELRPTVSMDLDTLARGLGSTIGTQTSFLHDSESTITDEVMHTPHFYSEIGIQTEPRFPAYTSIGTQTAELADRSRRGEARFKRFTSRFVNFFKRRTRRRRRKEDDN